MLLWHRHPNLTSPCRYRSNAILLAGRKGLVAVERSAPLSLTVMNFGNLNAFA